METGGDHKQRAQSLHYQQERLAARGNLCDLFAGFSGRFAARHSVQRIPQLASNPGTVHKTAFGLSNFY